MTAALRPLSTVEGLAAAGLIDQDRLPDLAKVASRYAVAITPAVAATIERGDLRDPIARQFVPAAEELITRADEAADPIGDDAHSPVKGIVHRYPDRALLKLSSVCPVYCRFCFRREAVGPNLGEALTADELQAALDYIRTTPAVWEVILTGGDPLILSPRRIAEVTQALAGIDHVKVIRWHTRVPVVSPERVTVELVAALRAPGKAVYVALHANHANEITASARAACALLVDNGIVMVSQSVLLRGVNDTAEALEALMRAFVETRIKPYYLHHLDRAPGTSHFRTSIGHGQSLMRQLRGRLSGLAQPTYVLDIPGGHGKVPIGPPYIGEANSNGERQITDFNGIVHGYCDCGSGGGVGS